MRGTGGARFRCRLRRLPAPLLAPVAPSLCLALQRGPESGACPSGVGRPSAQPLLWLAPSRPHIIYARPDEEPVKAISAGWRVWQHRRLQLGGAVRNTNSVWDTYCVSCKVRLLLIGWLGWKHLGPRTCCIEPVDLCAFWETSSRALRRRAGLLPAGSRLNHARCIPLTATTGRSARPVCSVFTV